MKVKLARQRDVSKIVAIYRQFEDAFIERGLVMPIPKYYNGADWTSQGVRVKNQFVLRNGCGIFGAMCYYHSVENIPESVDDGDYEICDNCVVCEAALDEAYIEALAIRKGHHGKGLGRILVDSAIRRARRAQMPVLNVESFCIYDTRGFYEKCGFELIDDGEDYEGHKYYSFSMKL